MGRAADALRAELARRELARRDFGMFMRYMHPDLSFDRFHSAYYKVLDLFAKGRIRNLIVTCPPQHGKALYYKELVRTANRGWVRHGDLAPGDLVFSPEGRPVRVLWNSGVYTWPCRKVSFAGGYSLTASCNHEWGCWIPDSSHKAVWHPRIETDGIMRMKRDRSPYIMCAEPLRMDGRAPMDPYQLGLWLGDGYSSSAMIAKRKDDIAFWESEGVVAAGCRQVGDADCYRTRLTAFGGGDLRAAGLLNAKRVPREFLDASAEDRASLVQGLMDSDGCCDARGNCEFCSVRRDIAEGMMELLRSLGHKPRMYEGEAKLYGRVTGPKFRVCFNPDRDDAVFRLPRKAERLLGKTNADRSDKRKHFIVSVEDAGELPCNCIQVEGGYYLAGKELIPTHNSEGSTRNLPAFMHGVDPSLRIGIVSYGFPLVQKFNRAVQSLMASDRYALLFPDTILPKTARAQDAGFGQGLEKPRNLREYGLLGTRDGGLMATGRGGALTGNPLDVGIIDDIYKDDKEANSPIVRRAAVDWYTDVFMSRLHNGSQQLVTFTRWHEDDLIGYLRDMNEREGTPFVRIDDLAMFDGGGCDPRRWYYINFEAIKEGPPTEIDPREPGEALWPERHSYESLMEKRKASPAGFLSLYQGNPMPREGLLYPELHTYESLPDSVHLRGPYAYVDPAGRGKDYLCAVVFHVAAGSRLVFVADVLYSDAGTDVTEDELADMLVGDGVHVAYIEANNGGDIFARDVKRILRERRHKGCVVQTFAQSANKEARIISSANNVVRLARMPDDWAVRWPGFYKATAGFKRLFTANEHDDAVDALTGCVEYATRGLNSYALYDR